jgi:hypothetical protein
MYFYIVRQQVIALDNVPYIPQQHGTKSIVSGCKPLAWYLKSIVHVFGCKPLAYGTKSVVFCCEPLACSSKLQKHIFPIFCYSGYFSLCGVDLCVMC